jgi:hypothetical protein
MSEEKDTESGVVVSNRQSDEIVVGNYTFTRGAIRIPGREEEEAWSLWENEELARARASNEGKGSPWLPLWPDLTPEEVKRLANPEGILSILAELEAAEIAAAALLLSNQGDVTLW